MNTIQNPGSALGEAIGAQMERALNTFLDTLCEELGYHFISASVIEGKKKLLLYDQFGTAFNIDAVIANESMQPIVLFESKYIRYKKHNRDKGSWLCTAHPAIRRRYHSIRSSIAVLAGNWSSSSLAMMRSFDINIFLIPFERICELLAHHDILFDWGEKDRDTAQAAWTQYVQLPKRQRMMIGEEMVALVKDNLRSLIARILDDSVPREIEKVTIELHSNLGEVKIHEFASIFEAVEFLNSEALQDVFLTTDSVTLFDPPPEIVDVP
ncbi:hypothetical protein GF339_14930 [candidate division KSB3 bacterium]|uniref:Uncharacterized protein n=1 Tax=candidate division KSB3 bacterium TaxID=2044937 RepID=A0A9D5JXB9_9BACT|nr:hypothetical protein [candidate division KSB3 bacterium]MBD3325878.1 hypothetical protein [candidate division KSB3 bacterium]